MIDSCMKIKIFLLLSILFSDCCLGQEKIRKQQSVRNYVLMGTSATVIIGIIGYLSYWFIKSERAAEKKRIIKASKKYIEGLYKQEFSILYNILKNFNLDNNKYIQAKNQMFTWRKGQYKRLKEECPRYNHDQDNFNKTESRKKLYKDTVSILRKCGIHPSSLDIIWTNEPKRSEQEFEKNNENIVFLRPKLFIEKKLTSFDETKRTFFILKEIGHILELHSSLNEMFFIMALAKNISSDEFPQDRALLDKLHTTQEKNAHLLLLAQHRWAFETVYKFQEYCSTNIASNQWLSNLKKDLNDLNDKVWHYKPPLEISFPLLKKLT